MESQRFYQGKPCRNCGETLRYVSCQACVECMKERDKNRTRIYPEGYLREKALKAKYGITQAEYEVMLENQGGGCAICGTSSCSSGYSLAVDHCHDSGKIRGILCGHCNTAIGKLKDDPALLRRAISYLTEHGR